VILPRRPRSRIRTVACKSIAHALPMAAPRAPSEGIPKCPKIRTQFTATFTTLPSAATRKGVRASPAACMQTAEV